jgi:dTDP-glucose 4,6-dehydratase
MIYTNYLFAIAVNGVIRRKMRIVITGGAGFLGSHLCDRCLKEGHDVVAVDNFITGDPNNIAHINSPHFSFRKQNISEGIFVDGAVDFILHFASPASPVDYLELPIQTLKVGALGTHNALGLARAKNAGLLLASTSEIYGDPLVHPQTENYWGNVNSIGPRGCYDEAKRFAEAIVMAYSRQHNIETRIVRIFNTYGPRMRLYDGRIVPNFIKQAILGEPLTIYGDGSQTRSFCYVSDLVDGIYRLMLSEERLPVNIGNPNEFTVQELAQQIIMLTNSTSQIAYQPLPEDDPKRRKPDITKAKKLLDWEPKVLLPEGLACTLASFELRINNSEFGRVAV